MTPTGRLRLARRIVRDGWTCRQAAERFAVAPRTACKRARRYRSRGEAGMAAPSCFPGSQRPCGGHDTAGAFYGPDPRRAGA
ncbi:leucine zipper domain-containing protein [Nocardiopsis chromatogenes]|uniref:leucine zipper domain-containing protein n=1 Tax=Nocardiopsis chromatogenes TaxID=280239 RepID=UPI000A019EE8|nr:leucine zipper domain-containing protein [Nocardiopsis chromatogenes]